MIPFLIILIAFIAFLCVYCFMLNQYIRDKLIDKEFIFTTVWFWLKYIYVVILVAVLAV